jgi:glycosyltransferase involved in cell wall biosynthesis
VKILMIAPTPFFSHRGTHIRILEEARSLEHLGHDVVIATYHIGDDIHAYIETNIDVRRIRRWLFWYKKTEAGPNWQKILLNILLIKKVFSLTLSERPDVIHAHLHEGVLIGRFVQWLLFWKEIRVVSDFHGSLVGEMRSHGYLGVPPLGSIFRWLERWINGMGDVAVVSGEENMDIIVRARKDRTVHHVGDGVNVSHYLKERNKIQLRKKYTVPENAFVVVYTGALIPNKGISHILEAIPFVLKERKDVHFVIGGYPRETVQKDVHNRDLADHVTIISPLNYFALAEVNMLGDIAVDPKSATVRQASGKILQYMAAQVGIICLDRPTNRQYLNDESAIFLKKMDAYTLTDAIVRFYDDRELVKKSSESAYADAQNFDWIKVGKKIEELYKSVIKKR